MNESKKRMLIEMGVLFLYHQLQMRKSGQLSMNLCRKMHEAIKDGFL